MPKIKKLSQVEADSNSSDSSPNNKDDISLNKYLSKYTDDDDVEPEQKVKLARKKSQKEPKPEIKTKNRLFADCQFEDSVESRKMEDF